MSRPTTPNAAISTASANVLAQTSANTNSVGTLGQSADSNYNQTQMQMLFDKLDEFINAARR